MLVGIKFLLFNAKCAWWVSTRNVSLIVVNYQYKWLVVRGPTLYALLWCDIASANTDLLSFHVLGLEMQNLSAWAHLEQKNIKMQLINIDLYRNDDLFINREKIKKNKQVIHVFHKELGTSPLVTF